MNRRKFLSLAALAGLPLSSCNTGYDDHVEQMAASCARTDVAAGDFLRIDAHCHLLNIRDAASAAFVNRHFVDDNLAVEGIVGGAVEFSSALAGQAVMRNAAEIGELKKAFEARLSSSEFCRLMSELQQGVFRASADPSDIAVAGGRATGFTSNKNRNAALMMAFWPEVDIFMPSHVDFSEENLWCRLLGENDRVLCRSSPDPTDGLYAYYMHLHLATRGRFLPMATFHPRRHFMEMKMAEAENNGAPPNPQDVPSIAKLRVAIEQWGFIAVKLHPTSGFDPSSNVERGCPNDPLLLRRDELPKEEKEAYDLGLQALYSLCNELEVPILTHGSDSLGVDEQCMRRLGTPDEADPLTWTNASFQWSDALTRPETPGFRVCLAHFASRFMDHNRNVAREYTRRLPVEFANPDNTELVPSAWLAAAMKHIQDHAGRKDLYLDLSFMVDLAYSSAAELNGDTFRVRQFFGPEYEVNGQYAAAFRRFLETHRTTFQDVTMYGSDWHMPGVSVFGPLYRPLLERVVPENMRQAVMGKNAAQFYGLVKGAKTRARLERFYSRYGLDLAEVPWIERVDRA
ncbi:MAG: amidohydrolase family protein [Pseudomonadota bacterium]